MIFAIDPGRTTGWAWEGGGTCGAVSFPATDQAVSGVAWRHWLLDQIADLRPTVLAVERAFMGRHRDADWTPHLIRVAHEVAYLHDIPRVELAAVSVRKRVFGKGRGVTDKERIAFMRSHDWDATTDHEADAAALLEAVRQMRGEQMRAAS